ncbi:MAG: Metal-dependent hydrolase YbeY, involved in rRNA and/or ribosome maturation and assembly [uncultured Sulfurovum sp.]|uniref:Endoribonuclease YbeY n=1 Tax=uncultured Sulfurovum sp. TaxID=269237 RepID=A0A6S6S622_9BACT|nr:MAG: Metal-dependent hydrolase YbeY, involved in rRNA and/or ribosome maturation and assembly [uncultured Sulfurovum sp.]
MHTAFLLKIHPFLQVFYLFFGKLQAMLNIENLTDFVPNIKMLESIGNSVTSREIDLTLCYNDTIQQYNKEYRQQNKATDVLSFPIINDIITDNNFIPLGSIVISIDFVFNKAQEYKHSTESEMALLFIHGLLHLLGYDHESDNGEMREKEALIIQNFNLPSSLIVRTEEN